MQVKYDKTLFHGTAWYYARYRCGYPQNFYEHFGGSKENFEDILERSPFKMLDKFEVRYTQEWTIDELIGMLYSTSYASRDFFGEKLKEFEEELRESLLKLDRSGKFTETAVLEALLGRKA